jgi:uncharacterized membrane protein
MENRDRIPGMFTGDILRRLLPAQQCPRVLRLFPPLIFATVVCAAMLLLRSVWSGHPRFGGFFGNLILAWIPLGLTVAIHWLRAAAVPRRRWLWFCAVCWFLFFPNASYIVTDMVHLGKYARDGVPKWFDIVLIMAHACTGLFLGCVSLGEMETLVRARVGARMGWAFSAGMLALASFGIYLGRFLRLNSWDVFVRPWRIAEKVSGLAEPSQAVEVLAFSMVFFLFSLGVYWFIAVAIRLADPDQATLESTHAR